MLCQVVNQSHHLRKAAQQRRSSMNYEPHLIAMKLSYFLMVWFVFSLPLSNKKTVASNFIVLVMWAFYSYILFTGVFDPISYEQEREVLIYIDGMFALLLSFILFFDKNAWKYALILCFAVLCHIMILLSIKNESYGFFYSWYDELIILTQLLMMAVSYDGTIRALRELQIMLHRGFSDNNGSNKGLLERKNEKGRT